MPIELISPTVFEYRSYLLRVWRGDHSSAWHAAIERVADGRRRSFSTLDDFITFLRDEELPKPDDQDSQQ